MSAKNDRGISAVVGMVFGVASIPLLYPWPFGVASAIIGFVFSLSGMKTRGRTMAIVGLVCSTIVLVVFGAATADQFFIIPKPPR